MNLFLITEFQVWYIHHYLEKHCEDDDKAFLVKCCLCCSVLESVEEMRSHFASNHAEVRKMYCSLEPCMYKPLSHRKSFKLHVKVSWFIKIIILLLFFCIFFILLFRSLDYCSACLRFVFYLWDNIFLVIDKMYFWAS